MKHKIIDDESCEYGWLEYNGSRYDLLQNPYSDQNFIYVAHAENDNGDLIELVWDIKECWLLENIKKQAFEEYGEMEWDDPRWDEFACNDESEMCDWDEFTIRER